MPDQKHSSAVDDILETLKQNQSSSAANGSVEDILADLGLEKGKAPQQPKVTQNFWQEPAQPPAPQQRSQPKPKQKAAKAAPPPPQEDERPAAPRLSDTIQLDSEFQKFFTESVAVIPDPEPEQHPGFFARFVGRRKNAAAEEEDEGLYAQEDYATELDAEPEEPAEEPVKRRFGFWHKWREPEEEYEEEQTRELDEVPPGKAERPAKRGGTPRAAKQDSGTVELPRVDDLPVSAEKSAPEQEPGTVELPEMEKPAVSANKASHPSRVPAEELGEVELPSVDETPVNEEQQADDTHKPDAKTVEMPVIEKATALPNKKKALEEPQQSEPESGAVELPVVEASEINSSAQADAAQKTVVLQPEELKLHQQDTGAVQLDVEWDNASDADATQEVEQPDDGGRPRLLGEETPGDTFEEEQEPEYVEDYENPADAPLVQQDLDRLRLTTAIRTGVSAVAGLILLYLGVSVGDSPLPTIGAVDPTVAPLAYLAVNLVLLLVACAVNWRVFWNGIRGLWGAPTPDSVLALAGAGALIQLVVLMMNADTFEADKVTLFAAPAALLLCFGALGKYLMSGVIRRNFELISTGSEHVAAFRLEDEELSKRLAEGLGEPEPCLVASRPTTLVEGFLRRSFSVRASDRMLQYMSWVLAGTALLTALIALFTKQGLGMAFTAFAGTLCLGGPASATLLAAVPGMLMQKSATRVGAVVPGWSSIEELSSANMIVVGAKDLFPAKSVRLHGIKTFEKQRIDLAILYAASVLIEGCDTLRDVFMNIIQGKTGILFPVESLENDPGFGFTAWVKDKRVIIGNRAMMEKQGVEIPSLDYEKRYTKGTKQPIYLAVSGRLFGMFLVSYKADEQAAHVLDALNRQGISVLVKSDDFSLTTELISQVYDLEPGCVKVLSGPERRALAPVTEYRQNSPGCMAHIGSFSSFVGGLLAAAGAASAERTSSLVQAAGVLVSAVLALLLSFTGGMAALALPALVLYQAAWAVLTLMIPMLKRYE